MGISTTTTCDQCSKTLGSGEKQFIDYTVAGTQYVFCQSCHEQRLTFANTQGLDYKDANISVTFNAAGVPLGGGIGGAGA